MYIVIVLFIDFILSVNDMNLRLKLSVYLQATLATETHLAEWQTSVRKCTLEDQNFVINQVWEYKQTISSMDEQ
jgi:hypothetical protein